MGAEIMTNGEGPTEGSPKGPTPADIFTKAIELVEHLDTVIILGLNKQQQAVVLCSNSSMSNLCFLEKVLSVYIANAMSPKPPPQPLIQRPDLFDPSGKRRAN